MKQKVYRFLLVIFVSRYTIVSPNHRSVHFLPVRPIFIVNLWLLFCFFVLQCEHNTVLLPERTSQVVIITPATIRLGEHLPIVIRESSGVSENVPISGSFSITGPTDISGGTLVTLKRGTGACNVPFESSCDVDITVSGCNGIRRIILLHDTARLVHSGIVPVGEVWWDATYDHIISGELLINKGTTIHIAPRTRILISGKANILVNGALHVEGSPDSPVIFTADDFTAPWGGIEVHGGSATFSHCFFANGGADTEKPFFHGNCQPVILAVDASVTLSNCYFLDNTGKAVGALRSVVTMDTCCISRCASGGEFQQSLALINGCHISDIPNGDGQFIDNDNDGIYLCNTHPTIDGPSRIIHTTIITGKDDAIDHNNAEVEITGCWLEDFMHEGVAASEGNRITIYNTVVKGCEQGIEAGYGSPDVFVDHCVVIHNDVGLRFGDSYDIGCSGVLTVQNTILHSNQRSIVNFDNKSAGPIANSIAISYSMVNDTANTTSSFCIRETPLLDENCFLLSGSPGYQSGTDASTLGLLHK